MLDNSFNNLLKMSFIYSDKYKLFMMVITFLPYPDFQKTAETLDMRRLGSTKNETRIIINTLLTGKGWINHPATRAWIGHIDALKLFFNIILQEWFKRGYKSGMTFYKLSNFLKVESKIPKRFRTLRRYYRQNDYNLKMPWWMGNEEYHYSHQAVLQRKKPDFYKFDFPNKYNETGYFWPRENRTLEPYTIDGKKIV